MAESEGPGKVLHHAFRTHSRIWERNRYVYPVLSRRAKGISIGINLNPDKVCNFGCIYCQVNREIPGQDRHVGIPQIKSELRDMLRLVQTGELFSHHLFLNIPPELRRISDIAFSGDGEPTTHANFKKIIETAIEVKHEVGMDSLKIVIITNASQFRRQRIQEAFELLDQHNGEIWAKLDAGTEEYYNLVNQASLKFAKLLENILEVARRRPIVIQSCFMRIHGEGPSEREIEAFCKRLREIGERGGKIKLVQVCTISRPPRENYVTSLSDEEVDSIAKRVRERVGVAVEGYYGYVG